MTKAVALLSGGLDSTLAVKLVMDQGVEVHALNFTSVFCTCSAGAGCTSLGKRVATELGIPIKVLTKGLEYMEIVRNPKHGYGKGVNPCVDCRIFMFKEAAKYMKEIGASFIITGEVLGQRPMSQRRDNFPMIEAETGLEGLILRPLSAKHLEPTIAEKEGLVDREKLMEMAGRSRKPQIELAEELDVHDYPCPSGGCLLTDKIFSKKVRDLMEHKKELTVKDLQLLKAGRHFRFEGVKVVIGRDEADNRMLKNLMQPGDTYIEPVDFAGPSALVAGEFTNGVAEFATALIIRYSSGKGGESGEGSEVLVVTDGEETTMQVASTIAEETAERYNVC